MVVYPLMSGTSTPSAPPSTLGKGFAKGNPAFLQLLNGMKTGKEIDSESE